MLCGKVRTHYLYTIVVYHCLIARSTDCLLVSLSPNENQLTPSCSAIGNGLTFTFRSSPSFFLIFPFGPSPVVFWSDTLAQLDAPVACWIATCPSSVSILDRDATMTVNLFHVSWSQTLGIFCYRKIVDIVGKEGRTMTSSLITYSKSEQNVRRGFDSIA